MEFYLFLQRRLFEEPAVPDIGRISRNCYARLSGIIEDFPPKRDEKRGLLRLLYGIGDRWGAIR